MPKRTPEDKKKLEHCNRVVFDAAKSLESEGYDLDMIADGLFCALVPIALASAGHDALAGCLEEWAGRIRSFGEKKLPPEILRLLN